MINSSGKPGAVMYDIELENEAMGRTTHRINWTKKVVELGVKL